MSIYNSMTELVGHTPIVRLNRLKQECMLSADILVKVESFNPMSSIKDRVGLAMLANALAQKEITHDTVFIEPTSGNTGIALAWVCAALGYKLVLTMPETMTVERRKILHALGARVVLTEGARGMKGAIEKADELQKNTKNSVILGQFSNPANPDIHRKTTAREILSDTKGKIDVFVAGVGTGGTITGVGKMLKTKNKKIHIVAVEPAGSPFLSKGTVGTHKIQGIGAGFVPPVLNTGVYDKIITVSDEDATWAARQLAKTEGILAGISSGAALWASMTLAKQSRWIGKTILTILPDTGERYLSTGLFEEM